MRRSFPPSKVDGSKQLNSCSSLSGEIGLPRLLRPVLASYEKEASPGSTVGSHVLLALADPGTCGICFPLAQELRQHGECRRLSLLASGFAHQALRRNECFKDFGYTELPALLDRSSGGEILGELLRKGALNRSRPVDVVVSTISSEEGVESYLALVAKKELGARLHVVIREGWSAAALGPEQLSALESGAIDAIICNDAFAAQCLTYANPSLSSDKLLPIGTPHLDAGGVTLSELCRRAQVKLRIEAADKVLLFLGTVSESGSDNLNFRAWRTLYQQLQDYCRCKPDESVLLLWRPHGRDSGAGRFRELAFSEKGPMNLRVVDASQEKGIDVNEAMAAAAVTASLHSTASLRAGHMGREGALLLLCPESRRIFDEIWPEALRAGLQQQLKVALVDTAEKLPALFARLKPFGQLAKSAPGAASGYSARLAGWLLSR